MEFFDVVTDDGCVSGDGSSHRRALSRAKDKMKLLAYNKTKK